MRKGNRNKAERILLVLTICTWPVFASSARSGLAPAKRSRVLSPAEFKQKLKGPILSIPTSFTKVDVIDYNGIGRMIRRAMDYRCGIVALTSGNGRYDRLSYDEVKELTKFIVETVGDRGLTIAASGAWDEDRVIEYLHFAEQAGASAVQIDRPKGLDCNDVTKNVEFYRKVAASTTLGIVLHGDYSEKLLKELVKIDSIVALKEDVDLTYYVMRQIVFGDRLAIFGGGDEARYLHAYPYGSPAYYSILYTISPKIGLQFWLAIQAKDLRTASDIVARYDLPFMERFSMPFWNASIEYFGGSERYNRPVHETLQEGDIRKMRQFFTGIGLEPGVEFCCHVAQGPSLPQQAARGGHIGGILDGNLIIAGGNNWSKDKKTKYWLKDSLVFSNGIWTAGPDLPKPLAYAMFSHDGSGLYVAGGTHDGVTPSSEVYRLTSLKVGTQWQCLVALPIPLNSGVGVIFKHKFYAACGFDGKSKLNRMWTLDISRPGDKWHECQSVPGPGRMFPALVASGKYLYLLGGLAEPSISLKDAYRYDPETDRWTQLADLPVKGYCWVGQPVDDNHLIIAGRAYDGEPGIGKGVWILNLEDMSMGCIGEVAIPQTTSPLISVANKQWWLASGEPDANKNRTENVSVIRLD